MYLNSSNEKMILDWLDFLQEYNFKIKHIIGITHVLPYHLSYLYRLLDLNSNKESTLDISKSKDVLMLNIDNDKDDEIAKRMKEFIVSVTDRQELPNEKKKDLIREKHNEGHVEADLLFKSFFRNGFYWKSIKLNCKKEVLNCQEYLKFNVGQVGFHLISSITT
jgi:hypothetical protein